MTSLILTAYDAIDIGQAAFADFGFVSRVGLHWLSCSVLAELVKKVKFMIGGMLIRNVLLLKKANKMTIKNVHNVSVKDNSNTVGDKTMN